MILSIRRSAAGLDSPLPLLRLLRTPFFFIPQPAKRRFSLLKDRRSNLFTAYSTRIKTERLSLRLYSSLSAHSTACSPAAAASQKFPIFRKEAFSNEESMKNEAKLVFSLDYLNESGISSDASRPPHQR